jgi:gas vesicle protein
MVSKTQGDFLWGTLIGTVLGAATALLLTPSSGQKLRQKMASQLNQASIKKTLKAVRAKAEPRSHSGHKKTSRRPHAH